MKKPLVLSLRPFLPRDGLPLADLLRDSVDGLMAEDYSAAQQQAWASVADEPGFADSLATMVTLVIEVDRTLAGFASLSGNNTLAHLYVAPRFARHGVGSQLCEALERLAAGRGNTTMRVDASDSATDFLALRGYEMRQRNSKERGGEWLTSTLMEKPLATALKSTVQ